MNANLYSTFVSVEFLRDTLRVRCVTNIYWLINQGALSCSTKNGVSVTSGNNLLVAIPIDKCKRDELFEDLKERLKCQ